MPTRKYKAQGAISTKELWDYYYGSGLEQATGFGVGTGTVPNLQTLRLSEWDLEFEQLMRNRLIMGATRYGRMRDKATAVYAFVDSAIKRLQLYVQDGNTEHLVDAANLCMKEFVVGEHPKKHFKSGDDTIHTELK
jgi:hypothetical protein